MTKKLQFLRIVYIIDEDTCLIMIVDEGRAARFPLAPAASRSAASPHALPTQRVNMGGLTYLERESIIRSYTKRHICLTHWDNTLLLEFLEEGWHLLIPLITIAREKVSR